MVLKAKKGMGAGKASFGRLRYPSMAIQWTLSNCFAPKLCSFNKPTVGWFARPGLRYESARDNVCWYGHDENHGHNDEKLERIPHSS